MRRIAGSLFAMLLLAACASEPTTPFTDGARPDMQAAARSDLAALRAATARYHRIDVAKAEGWDTQFPPGCFTTGSAATGAMGYHWLRAENVGTLDPSKPQLLIYEPQQNGEMRLVGMEFIYPGAPTDEAPVLFGEQFHYSARFQVWALHVWAWRDNPLGLHADWNPMVTCAYAADLDPGA